MPHVCGYLGRDSQRKQVFDYWPNTPECVLVKYKTSRTDLPVRLSEMFVHDRLLYFIAEPLQDEIVSLLDECKTKKPNIVVNKRGVLVGMELDFSESSIKQLLKSVACL